MVQKTVLKVNISCDKCKTNILKAVSGLQGVDKVEVDGAKGTVSVTGDADPYEIIVKTRKAGKFAEVVSIGPPPKPQEKKPEQKKPEEKKADHKPHDHIPFICPLCERLPVFPITPSEQPTPQCNIL
ncbi:heavy metal-associated isoprenylated plant protein 43-like [Salvia miltiorrhiza]|uniref:heavy metal-associated isoprenylated plant protein 43-like n=1 Tax=Salvia miltiorrhiza TaxID=226208 RepID=UPI0025AD0D01|nr:heavy metal-associated isoprenylated plant protein 43-like [Salvia miltiorrhiza]XP_057806882.1 heavy metal-associated isoprenylated plant protein 43-like [Salvia miltiorrhiza]